MLKSGLASRLKAWKRSRPHAKRRRRKRSCRSRLRREAPDVMYYARSAGELLCVRVHEIALRAALGNGITGAP